MPRSRRPWNPGAIYHIDARAHCGAPIFEDANERAFVVDRAARVFRETGVDCLAWSVLVNHYHLLVRCAGPPGGAILRLNTAIARRVRRHGGEGAVFQGRFFSALCTDEASFLARLAYVTANPIHHGVVPTVAALRRHPWSSLGEAIGGRASRLVDVAVLTSLLDPHADRTFARRRLVALCEMRVRLWAERNAARPSGSSRDPYEDDPPEPTVKLRRRIADAIGAPRTLGAVHGPPLIAGFDWEARAVRRELLQAEGWTPDRLVPVACSLTGGNPDAVRRGRRTRPESRARALVAHVACDHVAWELTRVAAAVGTTAVSVFRASRRGAQELSRLRLSAEEFLLRSRNGSVPSDPGATRGSRVAARREKGN